MISYHRRYQENTTLLNLLKYIFDILMVILTAYVLVSFSCTRTTILGGSMEPSINNDDTVLVNKFAYAIKGPKRFDCIAFEPDSIGSSKLYVKRVIGLPGETVQIKEGHIYINGELSPLMMKKVLCHELTHAAMFSYGIELSIEQEELLADLIATYG